MLDLTNQNQLQLKIYMPIKFCCSYQNELNVISEYPFSIKKDGEFYTFLPNRYFMDTMSIASPICIPSRNFRRHIQISEYLDQLEKASNQ